MTIHHFILVLTLVSSVNLQANSTHEEIQNILQKEYQINSEKEFDFTITDQFISQHNGVEHIYLQQFIDALPIWNIHIGIHIAKTSNQVYRNGELLKAPVVESSNFNHLSHSEILQQLAQEYNLLWNGDIKLIKQNDNKITYSIPELSSKPIHISPTYYHSGNQYLKAALHIIFAPLNTSDHFEIIIDVNTRKQLDQVNWTVYCNWESENECEYNHAKEVSPESKISNTIRKQHITQRQSQPQPQTAYDYLIFPIPVESPNHGNAQIVNSPWSGIGDAGTLGWHDNGNNSFNYTRGNNAWAKDDIDANNNGGYSPQNADLEFTVEPNFNVPPSQNLDGAITNLFYWNNVMHDVWYQYGFTEPGGNFQQDNLGRGGSSSDFVHADAQDGSGTNNANFSTPPDGENPRMQMYEWGTASSDLFKIISPSSISGEYLANQAAFGPPIPSAPDEITGTLVLVNDGSGDPTLACNTISNMSAVQGEIAFIDRGDCLFVEKIQNAQNAGALACVVCNNNANQGPISMGGGDNGGAGITIPSIMISKEDCDLIKQELPNIEVVLSKTTEGINKDSDFDSGVICHEYGHGISTRMVGGPSTSGCLGNDEQMGEGWSDYFGLMMTTTSENFAEQSRGIGTYLVNQSPEGNGIRNAPYSTSFSINNYTYGDSNNTNQISQPHGIGFVWCTAIWEVTWALVEEYGFDDDIYAGNGGNNLAMQLIMDGLQLTPCGPGMVDGRDAILLADEMMNGPDSPNQCIIWQAFSKRGMGYSADQGSAASRTDQTEAFDLPPRCSPVVYIQKTQAFLEVLPNGTQQYELLIINNTGAVANNVIVEDELPDGVIFLETTINSNYELDGNTLTIAPITLQIGEILTIEYQVQIGSGLSQNTTFFEDNVESGSGNWDLSNGTGGTNWAISSNESVSGNQSWFADNIVGSTDLYLEIDEQFTVADGAVLEFFHYYNTETGWDGGVVEIAINNGNWLDMEDYFVQNGYNSSVAQNPASAISGRSAFTGDSNGFVHSILDLSSLEGEMVEIRFRFASDEFVGGDGWYIDDISIGQKGIIQNNACVLQNDNEYCQSVSSTVSDEGQTFNAPLSVQLIAFLEGPLLNESAMLSELVTNAILPNVFTPNADEWESESIDFNFDLNDNVIDWVFVELRNAQNINEIVATKPALLLSDGHVINSNGNTLSFNNMEEGNYYVALKHKGHLGVVSSEVIALPNNEPYDFSVGKETVFGNDQLKQVGEIFCLYAGDFDQNGVINSIDFNQWISASAAVNQYLNWDADLNGVVNTTDYNLWFGNRSKVGSSAIQQ